jgi:hypothetical protein
MNMLKQVEPSQWPKANYNPVAYISLEPAYFVDKLGVEFFVECDSLGECETCLLKLEKVDDDIYFSLFRYLDVEEGVNILCDMLLPNTSKVIQEILTSMGVDRNLVTLS